MEEKLLEIINTVLTNANKPAISNLEAKHNLRNDIGFDSFNLAELTVRVEEAFDIDIFEDGLVSTIQEILDKLKK